MNGCGHEGRSAPLDSMREVMCGCILIRGLYARAFIDI